MRTLALVLMLAAIGSPALAQRGEEIWRGNLADGAWLGALTANGDVRVTEAEGTGATVHAEVRRGDPANVSFDVLRDGDRITVCAVTPDVRRCDHDGISTRSSRDRDRIVVDLHVTVPRSARIRATSGNGDVRVAAAALEAKATSGNGSVDVSRVAGRVDASSGNGAVKVEGVGGPVEASSGNGRVEVDTNRGPVSARSGNGDVRVRMATLAEPGDMRFSSGNGSVTVWLPADFSGEVEATTGNGRISTDFTVQSRVQGRVRPNRLEGVIGDGGPRIRLSSGNGSIAIRSGS